MTHYLDKICHLIYLFMFLEMQEVHLSKNKLLCFG